MGVGEQCRQSLQSGPADAAIELVGDRGGVIVRSVRNDQPVGVGSHVLGREPTHLTGADDQRGCPGESSVLADELDRRARERDDAVVDLRLGPGALASPERPLKDRLKNRTDPVGGPGALESLPDLAESLVFAEHHRL